VLIRLNHNSNYYLHPEDFSIQISIDQYHCLHRVFLVYK
jgi:hypothetical protein